MPSENLPSNMFLSTGDTAESCADNTRRPFSGSPTTRSTSPLGAMSSMSMVVVLSLLGGCYQEVRRECVCRKLINEDMVDSFVFSFMALSTSFTAGPP